MKHALLLHLLTAGSLAWIPNGVAVSAEEAAVQLFDMDAIRDASTLDATVIQDWHVVDGRTPSRQKVVEITVGEAYPGKDYRVRVQFAVPVGKKAKGLSLTGLLRRTLRADL